MNPEQYIKSFEKYIEAIIVPKYPEIESFSVKMKEGKGDWNFRNAEFVSVLQITFDVDGTEDEFENDIREEINTMKQFFSISRRVILVDWRFVVDGYWNEEWYR
jgi:hypothetical protein